MATKVNILPTRVSTELLLGRIVQLSRIGINRIPCAQVRCNRNEMNIYLKKFFGRSFDFWALDTESKGSLGDTVLIRAIDAAQRPTDSVTHRVEKVVFQYGNVVDPVTGKRVIRATIADEIDLRKALVEEIVEKPLEQDSLLFEERRAVQRSELDKKKTDLNSDLNV